MPEYTAAALAGVAVVLVTELAMVKSGILKERAYWLTVLVALAFQVPVDGWLTKHSAPIVMYEQSSTTGIRVPWDIPIEDFLFGFALITLVLSLWQWQARP
jgi:lycopene cyclase domain-containing protein